MTKLLRSKPLQTVSRLMNFLRNNNSKNDYFVYTHINHVTLYKLA